MSLDVVWGYVLGARTKKHAFVKTGYCNDLHLPKGYRLCDHEKSVKSFDLKAKNGLVASFCAKCQALKSQIELNEDKVTVNVEGLSGTALIYAFSVAKGLKQVNVSVMDHLVYGRSKTPLSYHDHDLLMGFMSDHKVDVTYEKQVDVVFVNLPDWSESHGFSYGSNLQEALAKMFVKVNLGENVDVPKVLVKKDEA